MIVRVAAAGAAVYDQRAGVHRPGQADGFDGIILGHPHSPYHLEFTTQRGHQVGTAPMQDHLLVFYLPDHDAWEASCARMLAAGFRRVPSYNPYWEAQGQTFEDLDGYRVVLQNAA